MSNGYDLAALVLARLRTLPTIEVFDNEEVEPTPTKAFVIFRDGEDQLFTEHLDGAPRRYRWSFELVCAGTSQEQVRSAISKVRNVLAGWRIDGCLLNEVNNGSSVITDTSIPADVRLSRTLEFRLFTNWS